MCIQCLLLIVLVGFLKRGSVSGSRIGWSESPGTAIVKPANAAKDHTAPTVVNRIASRYILSGGESLTQKLSDSRHV
jgi:aspartate/methionine/tyrosine aminotransferase